MTKWRITEITHYPGTKKKKVRNILSKKDFLDSFGGMIHLMMVCMMMGIFGSFDAALEAINDVITYPGTRKVVWGK